MLAIRYSPARACHAWQTLMRLILWAGIVPAGVVTADIPGFAAERNVGTAVSSPLIRPWNFDPADETAYVRRQGQPGPGGRVTGAVWNAGSLAPDAVRPSEVPAKSADGDVLVEVAGYSVRGVPLVVHHFGSRGERVLIFGGIHGNEENSAELARLLVAHLRDNRELWRDRRVAVLPVANPDGIAKASRTNSRGVDLNRNFPAKNWATGEKGPLFGGESSSSEPETQVLVQLVETFAPDRIVSIHAITRGRECNNFDGPGQLLAERMSAANALPVKKSIGYPTPGSFGTWAGVERQVPTITLELPQGMPGEDCWKQQRTALEAAIAGTD